MKKGTTLYNVLFPVWMLMLFPQIWLIVLPGNFLIDSLVIVLSMYALKIQNKKDFYKKTIVKTFSFGIISDVIGSLYMLLMMMGFEIGRMGDEMYLTVPALLISACFIFLFNYFFTFKNYDKSIRLKIALILLVVTSPYTFLIPSRWIY